MRQSLSEHFWELVLAAGPEAAVGFALQDVLAPGEQAGSDDEGELEDGELSLSAEKPLGHYGGRAIQELEGLKLEMDQQERQGGLSSAGYRDDDDCNRGMRLAIRRAARKWTQE